jgi:transposase
MPPSLQEWLPQDHLVWFVLAAVEEMDLAAFYAVYRGNGVGRPAHDPGVMVALLLYAYSRGQRSSRRIERACVEDIAHRVICVNEVPDHTTIARFRQRHENAIADLFSDVLRLCADAGLAGVGLVAVDGTKVHADASHHANRDYDQIARGILAEADAIDAQEDEKFGDRRGDELPLELQAGKGPQEWLRAGRKRLEAQRDADAKPIPASRPERLKESKRRLQEELWAEMRANDEYLAYRARGVMSNGRRLGPSTVPKPWVAPDTPTGKINVTDLDSRKRQDAPRLPAGLQRPGRLQRAADRDRR